MSFKFQDYEIDLEYETYTLGDGSFCVDCEARNGSTVLLCKVNVGKWAGFGEGLPINVNYSERFFANNKIPAGFSKRENKREVEIIIGRFIERAIKATIDESFRFSLNINCTVLSYSKACPPEALAVTAASSALLVAGVPCNLVVGVYLNRVNGRWTSNSGNLNYLLVSGNYYGVSALEMCGEQLSPDQVSEGIRHASTQIGPLVDFVRQRTRKYKQNTFAPPLIESHNPIVDTEAIIKGYFHNQKESLISLSEAFISKWSDKITAKARWDQIVRSVIRTQMIWSGKRVDGRDFDSIRHTSVSKNFIPSHHCLVNKSKTKVLSVLTFSNNPNEYQLYETLEQNENRKLIVHYNSQVDLKSNHIQKWEIDTGNFIRNSIKTFVLNDRFIRIVNEVIRSDGGAPAASVLASGIALQNAGIEMPPVYGVSIGLIIQSSAYKFFMDLNAVEREISDIHLKLGGTRSGFTALQLEIKVPFLPWHILEHGLQYGFNALIKGIKGLNEIKDVTHIAEENDVQRMEKNTNPVNKSDNKNQEQKKPHKDSRIMIQLDEVQIARLVESKIDDQDTVINGKILTSTSSSINKLLMIALNSNKEVFFSKVVKIVDDLVDLQISSNGNKIQIKKEACPDLSPGQFLAISKGKFGRWIVVSKLEKYQVERSG